MKKKQKSIYIILFITAIIISITACQSLNNNVSKLGVGPAFGSEIDVKHANSLWKSLNNYQAWSSFPDMEGWQDSGSPHGDVAKLYINKIASKDSSHPAHGSIIIKENYAEKNSSSLMAITVMQRIKGYDPASNDWFWVKYSPTGKVLKNPKGMALAGRIAKGMTKGCISCHKKADDGDFLFSND